MNSRNTVTALPFVGLLTLGTGPAPAQDDPKPAAAAQPQIPAPGTQPTHKSGDQTAREFVILDIARQYSQYHLASPWPAWTIASCRVVMPGEVPGVPSRSDDQRTHGDKIYKLWVSNNDSYWRLCGFNPKRHSMDTLEKSAQPLTASPNGQTLVKETFASIPVPASEEPKPNPYRHDLIVDGDKAFRQGAPAELFIMTKVDPKTPDTDNGWIYAVVSTDRKTVLRSGRIESCMHCHEQTMRDRLYGPEETWPKDKEGKAMLPIARAERKTDSPTQQAPKTTDPKEKAAPTEVPPKKVP